MQTTKSKAAPICVLALTSDAAFAQSARTAIGQAAGFELTVAAPGQWSDAAALARADLLLADVTDHAAADAVARLLAVAERSPPVVAVTAAFDAGVARKLIQLRVADLLLAPVTNDDLLRACLHAVRGATAAPQRAEAKICAFLPASGGVGVTTLAIETALLLTGSGRRGAASTCLVDLDFQHGTCADYLDLDPRLDLDEIEPRPERLDSQLLEVMLSHHSSGLSIISAPSRPAEMRSFDPQIVTRLLDLVSVRFEHVVLDLPRTWFAWTDNVLLGSDQAFIITEATVPGIRHAQALIAAIKQRLGNAVQPRVIVNRFEQRMFATGIKRTDITEALGEALAGTVPNNYRLVREAIDRGVPLAEVKPRNDVTTELKKIVMPAPAKDRRSPLAIAGARLGLFPAT